MGAPAAIELTNPASTWMSCPLIQRASDEPRNEMMGTTSSTVPYLPTVERTMSKTSRHRRRGISKAFAGWSVGGPRSAEIPQQFQRSFL
jgi:hypothetical protein